MSEKIKVIIADDNKQMCEFMSKFLKQYEDIEILGIANTDVEEITMIEELNPEIVITDLMRNYKYTGLEIIEKYFKKKGCPEFLVISADNKTDVIKGSFEVAGYIRKPFYNYEIIVDELRRIKKQIRE